MSSPRGTVDQENGAASRADIEPPLRAPVDADERSAATYEPHEPQHGAAAESRRVEPGPPGRIGRRKVGRGELDPQELLRWVWRQLTSMRTALMLLFLLAIAAIPGSFVPQRTVDPQRVAGWQRMHPGLTPTFERLGLFDVYGSVWFSAVYLLLVASLVGCIVPRTLKYVRTLRDYPAPVPRDLSRIGSVQVIDAGPRTSAAVLGEAATALRRRGYQVRVTGSTLSAERGRLREIGNLLFHIAVLVVLAGFVYGKLFGFTGAVIVVQGESFINTRSGYDNFTAGSLVTDNDIRPFTLTLDDFAADYLPTGQPSRFAANVTFSQGSSQNGGAVGRQQLQVNKPLTVAGTDVFLVGHGYAPVLVVRDGNGNIVNSGPSIFLPQNASLQSYGVIKAPDAQPTSLALEGDFYPSFSQTPSGTRYSAFPGLLDPRVVMQAYSGDLGMDRGAAQNVYNLDKTRLSRLSTVTLSPGQSVDLPGGAGSVTFAGIQPWARLQISTSPGDRIVLAGVMTALVGLLCSLFIRRRRIWMRVGQDDDAIEVAAVSGRKDLVSDDGEVSRLLTRLGVAPPRKEHPRAGADH